MRSCRARSRAADASEPVVLTLEAQFRRSGATLRLVQAGGALPGTPPDAALVRLLLLARRWWAELRQGEIDVTAPAAREQHSSSYVTRIVRLAFLSPAVTSAILHGRQRAGVGVAALLPKKPVPVLWREQARALLSD